MLNINFVPDDYVQSGESRRTNVMCLVLLALVMAALGGSFGFIKIRQRACRDQESVINGRLTSVQKSIKQYEELQSRRKAMMKTALTTAELLEPVPRSVVLASLTNSLPAGVSLLDLNLIQKQPKGGSTTAAATSKYQAAQSKTAEQPQARLSQENTLETQIDIGGMAPSDLQVAAYIERLSMSQLLDNVALVESKEYKVEDTIFRQFKLRATLGKEIHLTAEDVDLIRTGAEESIYRF
ncbi:MAG: PilN domain-containing protein [Sedimentisphaerales bacterium]|nr:PilN domain-containing protein [Sedimentisphaerales bacterium]